MCVGNVDSALFQQLIQTLSSSSPDEDKVSTMVAELDVWYRKTLGQAYSSYPTLQTSLILEATYLKNLYNNGLMDSKYNEPMAKVFCSKVATDQGTDLKPAVSMNYAAGCGKDDVKTQLVLLKLLIEHYNCEVDLFLCDILFSIIFFLPQPPKHNI